MKKEIKIDTSKIPAWRGKLIGEAFYKAYKEFVSVPENAVYIKKRVAELEAKEATAKVKNV